MKSVVFAAVSVLAVTAPFAQASSEYRPAFQGCRAALAERLDVSANSHEITLKKVKTHARDRNVVYKVPYAQANGEGAVFVDCTVKKNGDVLAMDFVGDLLPVAAQ